MQEDPFRPIAKPMSTVARQSRAVTLAREVSAHLNGRICLFKAKGYMGPVRVISARSNTRRIRLHLQTYPWEDDYRPSEFSIDMPITGVSATAFSVIVNAGYGVNAIIVSNHIAIAAIGALKSAGASTQKLLNAFNRAGGLPPEVIQLRDRPFVPSPLAVERHPV